MKRFLVLALLVALAAVGFASNADARSHSQLMKVPTKSAGTDSSFVSLPNGTIPFGGVGGTNADPDTLEWIQVSGYNLQNCTADGQSQVMLHLSAKATAPTVVVGDSLAIQVQYAFGNSKPTSSTTVYSKAVQYAPMTVGGTTEFSIISCQELVADPAQTATWIRVLIADGDLSRTAPWENVVSTLGLVLQSQ